MTETQLKSKVQAYLRSIGAFYMKWSDRFSIGVPDMVIVYQGRVLFIELKTPRGIVAGIQKYHIDQINKHGGEAYVCRSVKEVEAIIDREDIGL